MLFQRQLDLFKWRVTSFRLYVIVQRKTNSTIQEYNNVEGHPKSEIRVSFSF